MTPHPAREPGGCATCLNWRRKPGSWMGTCRPYSQMVEERTGTKRRLVSTPARFTCDLHDPIPAAPRKAS